MSVWSFRDKSGVSEMVSYVLIVVMGIGLSILVFSYLSLQTPKDRAECAPDTNLIIKSWSCSIAKDVGINNGQPISEQGTNTLLTDITMYNKGFHAINGVYLRAGPESKQVKTLINAENLYFVKGANVNGEFRQGLLPGRTFQARYDAVGESAIFPTTSNTLLSLELEPAVGDERGLTLCEAAIATQSTQCETCGNGIINAAEDCDYDMNFGVTGSILPP